MTKVNIVFDDTYNDVDIIAVPDEIASKIETISQEFLYWNPPVDDSDYWIIINGKKYLAMETDGFIKWLNSSYCQKFIKAYVVARNTRYRPEYKIIKF